MAKARDIPKADEDQLEQMKDQQLVELEPESEPEPEPEVTPKAHKPERVELDANGNPMGPYSKQFPVNMPTSEIKKLRDKMARYPVAVAMPTGTDPLNREPLTDSMLNEFASSYVVPLGHIRSLRFVDQGGTLLQLDHRGNGRYELRMVGE